ncbi:hypothetical protein Tco_1281850 [Tanacetum coccineum]
MSRRVESSEDQESLGAPEDASKQGRSIEDIDVDVSLVDETQERQDDDLMFDTGVLDDVEMPVEAKVDRKGKHSTKPDDSTAGEAVTTASVEPKVVTTAATNTTTIRPKDRGVVVHEPSEKDQIALDEQIARDIQAKLDLKGSSDGADNFLTERLQSRENKRLTIGKRKTIYGKLMKKEENILLALRAQEKKPYLLPKHKREHQMRLILSTLAMGSEVQESKEKKEKGREETTKGSRKKMLGRKRAGKEQQQESSQKVEEEKESDTVDEYDEAELKKRLVIKKRMEVPRDTLPDQECHNGIDNGTTWKLLGGIVKANHGDKGLEKFERVLLGDLKVMFEPDIKSDIWRMLQGYRLTIWKLIDSSGVHFVRYIMEIMLSGIKENLDYLEATPSLY